MSQYRFGHVPIGRVKPNRGAGAAGADRQASTFNDRIPCHFNSPQAGSLVDIEPLQVPEMPGPTGIDACDLSSNPRFLFRQPRALQWFEDGRLVKRHDCERQAGEGQNSAGGRLRLTV